jgi:hypothetical protein
MHSQVLGYFLILELKKLYFFIYMSVAMHIIES